MMLKVVQYAYTQSVFSDRKIDVDPVFRLLKIIKKIIKKTISILFQ